ncbi:putative RDD family membrane protein YckC [Mucilaginibacter yixingensis]|uniref:Putative RDD family membrane protein YckC n=1 Tax=Mucilaginibacter yixingensis TaxID=1295612 RepID=A0A2T5JB53_9SPHI|nr:RDD family protein [Mucilaginibacter yixingensis]PTQ98009.1 putative RDD family membrane protein YckC [Mucilaginibacter yixingensis]
MTHKLEKYLLVINGRPEGPFAVDELRQRGLKPGDFVRTDGMADYKEAHEVPELRALFGFKKQTVAPQYFGSFDQRLLASVIDWLLVSAGFAIVALCIVLAIQNQMMRSVIAVSLAVIIPVANFIYHVAMESSAQQATYGKQILKIKVTDMEGRRITTNRAVGRNLARVFSVCTFYLGYLYSFFNKKQQCLHDVVAGTLVVKDRLI